MRATKGSLCRQVELAAMNAWPARVSLFVDGFVLRLDAGYTRRANSATALLAFRRPVEESLDRCEAFFAGAGLSVNFRMLSEPAHPRIEALSAYHYLAKPASGDAAREGPP